MAQTKNRSATARSSASKRAKSGRSGSAGARKSTGARKGSGSGAGATRNGSSANGVEAVRQAVGGGARSAGQAVGKAANKAKLPLVAGGAALAGAAGGAALASRQARKGGLGSVLRRPQIKVDSHDVSRAAKEVGKFGAQVGELANELRRTREASGNGKKARSPVEVVLQGLTARR